VQHPSNPAARVDFGAGYFAGLFYRPSVLPAHEPGHVTLVLGNLPSGREARIDVTDLAWLDALESAIQVARAEGVIEAGMRLAVTP
jgi:hypothetical protein